MLGAESQTDLLGGSAMLAQAEQHEAAQRIFLSSLDVACRMGTPLDRARRFACDQAKRATGLDWAAALTATTSPRAGPPPAPADAVAAFMGAWQAGTLGLPWVPALSLDAHRAFCAWARREGRDLISSSRFVYEIVPLNLMARKRCRWQGGPKQAVSFLIPRGQDQGSVSLSEWLASSVSAFRAAASEVGLG
ncbi:hypothetical protein [Pseudoxanthomonas mexicana]